MKRHLTESILNRQSGAALIVVLVMLVVLTLLGINGAQQSVMQERMVGNFRDQQIAFEVSEATLRKAEDIVLVPVIFNDITDSDWLITGNSADGLYEGDQGLDPLLGTHTRKAITDTSVKGESAANPEYYIERLPEVYMAKSSLVRGFPEQAPKVRNFRATSRAKGKTTKAEVVLQSTVYR